MSLQRWRIGECEVICLPELEASALIQSVITEATPANIRQLHQLRPSYADDSGALKAVVQCFLVVTPDGVLLVDTGVGNAKIRSDVPEWDHLNTPFLQNLANMGCSKEDVSAVVCTHIHMDHVGWNTELSGGEWRPTFTKAQYYFVGDEYKYWSGTPAKEIPDDHRAFADSVQPIVEAGQARLVEADATLNPWMRFIPAPGHTPHHSCVAVVSKGESALIAGDLLHHPCQVYRPEWTTGADTYPDIAAQTRRRLLGELASSGSLLLGGHFPAPAGGRIRKDPGTDGFTFVPER